MEEESVDHLFVHCPVAYKVWGFLLSHLRIALVLPLHFSELISGWWILDLECVLASIWSFLPGAICLGLWKERNHKIFEGKSRCLEDIYLSIYKVLFDWVSIRMGFEEREWYSFWCEV